MTAQFDLPATTEHPRLTPAEDHELRQLTWFSKVGHLSEQSAARLADLMARDRRTEVRDPRPNPSGDGDELYGTTLPEPDRLAASTCPNCGFLLPEARS